MLRKETSTTMQDVVLDACCVINLYAAEKILSGEAPRSKRPRRRIIMPGSSPKARKLAFDFKLHLPAKVKEEARYILQPDEEDESKLVKTDIDLDTIIQAGFLHECDLEGEEETELFVQMATRLDDGEAVCFAIAKSRGWLLATDERPTENLAKKHGVQIITTPELVKHWVDRTKASEQAAAKVLWNIQSYAHYFPRKTLPLHAWWMRVVKKSKIP
jgi:predicted nucleic acid-binding protein